MLKKLNSISEPNQTILRDFHEYMLSKNSGERHIINSLNLLMYLDRYLQSLVCKDLQSLDLCKDFTFTSINSKEQLLTFLEHHEIDGKWVKREHDAEGKYINSFNFYLGLLRTFFRWLSNSYCKHKSEDDWETPAFLKIKLKKPIRDSPYGINDIWERDDVLAIVPYEQELRNQAIITLLWDLDARPHEITALRVKDIILDEQYGEGTIPSNTKTGGGPILLTSSFTYVRDWINRHPFKNESNARLICNLYTGRPIKPTTIWLVLRQLRNRIKRLVESESITIDVQRRQKLEYLLRAKKWNPYCFRHSAITDDSDHLPEYAVKKKVRWVMNSQQGRRYIKNIYGDELKNRILEHNGIKIPNKQQQMVSRVCWKCQYVNKLENKYCERVGCNCPLTQLALDEIKTAEQTKMQQLINESNLERDNTIQVLQQDIMKLNSFVGRLINEHKWYVNKFGLSEPTRKKTGEIQEQLRALPPADVEDYYEDD